MILRPYLFALRTLVCRGDRTRTCDSLVPNQERYQLRYTSKAGAKVRNKIENRQFFTYFMIPCSTKIFFRATTERSTCSFVWVAMSA